jgi:hypothetical protein
MDSRADSLYCIPQHIATAFALPQLFHKSVRQHLLGGNASLSLEQAYGPAHLAGNQNPLGRDVNNSGDYTVPIAHNKRYRRASQIPSCYRDSVISTYV